MSHHAISILDDYASILELSQQMVLCAQDNDWNQLAELELKVAKICSKLQEQEQSNNVISLSQDQKARKKELIEKILTHQQEIRVHTDAWMDSVKILLGSGARQRNLNRTYEIK